MFEIQQTFANIINAYKCIYLSTNIYFYANQFKCGSRFHTVNIPNRDHCNLSQQIDAVTSVPHTTIDQTHTDLHASIYCQHM